MKRIDTLEEGVEHFIPVRLEDVVTDLLAQSLLPEGGNHLFQRLCKIYISLYHAKFYTKLQRLKHCYLPFSPDRVTLNVAKHSQQELEKLQNSLIEDVADILKKANFRPISRQELNDVMVESSPYGILVSIDFNEFDELHLYYCGLDVQTERRRDWRSLFIQSQSIEIPIYRRLFLLLKFKKKKKQQNHQLRQGNFKQYLVSLWQHLFEFKYMKSGDEGAIYLKLFKNIPRSDLEMLFPNTRVQMKVFDKVTLGITGGSGIIGGIMAIFTKIVRAANPYTILMTIAGFIGIIWREISKLLASRNKYLATLAKSLYFHNLDNNLGVLMSLIEMAEEEECKEAILAYYFLCLYGADGCTREELDKNVEHYLSTTYHTHVDFELRDGIAKLIESGLVQQKPEGIITACQLEQAIHRLEQEWDEML